ncbi:MAG: RluA family pseudouridine synthase [Paludibacteraceae bacterium]|nr:RluA family pseudouridine synthase [Paludibacteraceae bacterium]
MDSRQKMYVIKVDKDAPLLEFLFEKLKGQSRTSVKSLLQHRQLMLNGQTLITKFDYPLKKGDAIHVLSVPKAGNKGVFDHPKLTILYEDDDIIVVDKKEGLLSVKTPNTAEESATHLLNQYLRPLGRDHYVYAVHRLDRETSGVMMFAKKKEVQQMLRDDWRKFVVERTYIAIAEGVIEPAEGKIESYLKEDIKKVMHSSPTDNGGQFAVTNYKVLQTDKRNSLVKLNLETGRKNQIRVHLQSIGHSVVGDVKYGGKSSRYGRLCLHAETLRFKHPVSGKLMAFSVPVPFKL